MRANRWLFAVVPVAALTVLATIVLTWLERTGRWSTERADDAIAYAPVHLLTRIERDGGDVFRFSDHQFASVEFPEKKPEATFRIFVLGESFAAGTPFNLVEGAAPGEGTPAAWLATLLRIRFPGKSFEVIPAATGGATSRRVREIALELLEKASPDLLVIASGNNEGYYPGRLNEELHRWIVYRALKKTLLTPPRGDERPANMPQPVDREDALQAFRRNLDAILTEARMREVAVVLCTLPANLRYDIRPSASRLGGLSPDFLSTDKFLLRGRELLREGDYERALDEFLQSPNRGVVLFHIGECLEALGRFDDAREAFRQHLDILPICRAGWRVNAIIRDLVRERGAALCDLESAIERVAPNGIPGFSLFYDSCHMRWFGYYHVANAMLETAHRADMLPPDWGTPGPAPPVDDALHQAGWAGLPERAMALNNQYRVFQGDLFDPGEDPRVAVPLAFEPPGTIPE